MKPLGTYPTAEQAIDDWIKEPTFLSLSQARRQKSLSYIRDQWAMAHSKTATQMGAGHEDLIGKAHDILTKIIDMAAPPILGMPNPMGEALKMMLPKAK